MKPKVIIVGGGVIGLSIAWSLLRTNQFDSTIIEKDDVGKAASWTAGGMLAPYSEIGYEESSLFELNKESLNLYPTFLQELFEDTGEKISMSTNGTMLVATTRDEREQLQRFYTYQQSQGLPTAWITTNEAREREPYLSPKITAAIYSPQDSQIDNRHLLTLLKRAILNRGGTIREKTFVKEIIHENAIISGVKLDSGEMIPSDVVILSSGAWSKYFSLPIRPMKGQLIILKMNEPIAHVIRTPRIYIIPKDNGTIKIGATSEDVGFNFSPTAGAMMDLLKYAWEVVPAMYDFEFLEVTVNGRPAIDSNIPLIAESDVKNLFYATGHYRNGILLAPITGKKITAMILKNYQTSKT